MQAILDQAAAEAASQTVDIATLPDLSQPGPYAFVEDTITITNPALRQTREGLTVNYDFDVDVYLPQGMAGPAPVVIVFPWFWGRQRRLCVSQPAPGLPWLCGYGSRPCGQ